MIKKYFCFRLHQLFINYSLLLLELHSSIHKATMWEEQLRHLSQDETWLEWHWRGDCWRLIGRKWQNLKYRTSCYEASVLSTNIVHITVFEVIKMLDNVFFKYPCIPIMSVHSLSTTHILLKISSNICVKHHEIHFWNLCTVAAREWKAVSDEWSHVSHWSKRSKIYEHFYE